MYCGNNRNNPDILNGSKYFGTRYRCFQKGIGMGLRLPYDKDFEGLYVPLDDRKIYCGNGGVLPPGYDLMGSNSMCLQKGVGLGKSMKVARRKSRKRKRSSRRSKRRSKRRSSRRSSKRRSKRRIIRPKGNKRKSKRKSRKRK